MTTPPLPPLKTCHQFKFHMHPLLGMYSSIKIHIPSQPRITESNEHIDHNNASMCPSRHLISTNVRAIDSSISAIPHLIPLRCNTLTWYRKFAGSYSLTQRMNATITMSNYYLGQGTNKLLYFNYASQVVLFPGRAGLLAKDPFKNLDTNQCVLGSGCPVHVAIKV